MSPSKIVYAIRWQSRVSVPASEISRAVEFGRIVALTADCETVFFYPLSSVPHRPSPLEMAHDDVSKNGWTFLTRPLRLDSIAHFRTPESDVVMCIDLLLHPEGGEVISIPMYKGKSLPAPGP